MRFKSHRFDVIPVVTHKHEYMIHNGRCGDFMSHKQEQCR